MWISAGFSSLQADGPQVLAGHWSEFTSVPRHVSLINRVACFIKAWKLRDVPGGPVVKNQCLYCEGALSLAVRKLKSHMPCSVAKKNKIIQAEKTTEQQRESSRKTVVKIFCNKSQKWYPSTPQYWSAASDFRGEDYTRPWILKQEATLEDLDPGCLARNRRAQDPTDDSTITPMLWELRSPTAPPTATTITAKWSSIPTNFQCPTSASIDKPYLEFSFQGSLEEFSAACNSERK